MQVRKRIPNYFDGLKSWEGSVETKTELESLDFIASWAKDPGFSQFVTLQYFPDHYTHPYALYAEFLPGSRDHRHVCVAFLENNSFGYPGPTPLEKT